MKTEFTKGEWKIDKTYASGKKCNWIRIFNINKNVIAEVKGIHCGINRPEMNANAKLIAAAPNLLNALIHLLDELEDQPISSSTNLYIENAKIAIKKATE